MLTVRQHIAGLTIVAAQRDEGLDLEIALGARIGGEVFLFSDVDVVVGSRSGGSDEFVLVCGDDRHDLERVNFVRSEGPGIDDELSRLLDDDTLDD